MSGNNVARLQIADRFRYGIDPRGMSRNEYLQVLDEHDARQRALDRAAMIRVAYVMSNFFVAVLLCAVLWVVSERSIDFGRKECVRDFIACRSIVTDPANR